MAVTNDTDGSNRMADTVTTTVDGDAQDPIDPVEGATVGAEHAADAGDDDDE